MIFNYFKTREEDRIAIKLYQEIVKQSRHVEFYKTQIKDTKENRFELICLHLSLILMMLNDESKLSFHVKQALTDVFVKDIDANLRELGIGDSVLAKQIKKLVAHSKTQAKIYASWESYTKLKQAYYIESTFFEPPLQDKLSKDTPNQKNLCSEKQTKISKYMPLVNYITKTKSHLKTLNILAEIEKKYHTLFIKPEFIKK